MISDSHSSLLEGAIQVGLAAWVFGHVAKDVLNILGDICTVGIRLAKILRKQIRG